MGTETILTCRSETGRNRFIVKRKAAFIFSLLFVLSGALALYAECAQAANHPASGAGHEAPSVHCPDGLLNSSIQAASATQSHSRNSGKVLPILQERIDSVVSVARFKDHPSWKPFSKQDLYRFEEVWRL